MIKQIKPIKTASKETVAYIQKHGPTFKILAWDSDNGWSVVPNGKKTAPVWLPETEVMLIA